MKRITYIYIITFISIILIILNFFALIFSNYGAYIASEKTIGGDIWENIFYLIGNILVIYFLLMIILILTTVIYIWYEYIYLNKNKDLK